MADLNEDRNPSPPHELLTDEDLIHADNIGDTVFSKHWLFTTLMKLIEEVDKHDKDSQEQAEFGLDVDEDLQNELCKLWDMSMNGDVAKFLKEFKAIEILTGVILKSRAPRVTEISIGILGNMACNSDVCNAMSQDQKLVDMVVMLLGNPDTETLLETMRLLYTSLSSGGEMCRVWTDAIKADENSLTNVKFILSSSTNGDLLKNTGEFLDKLLDVDEEICDSWARDDLVYALLEAIKQIGFCVSEALDTYLHIFQLLSTTEDGVAALISNCTDVYQAMMMFLQNICEDEILGLEGREGSLAAAVSVLNALVTSAPAGFDMINTDSHFMRCLLKILEALYPRIEQKRHIKDRVRSNEGHERPSTAEDKEESKTNGGETSEVNDRSQNSASRIDDQEPSSSVAVASSEHNNGPSAETQHSNCCSDDPLDQLSFDNVTSDLLYSIIQGFLVDIVKLMSAAYLQEQESNMQNEETEKTPALLEYLDSTCHRSRICTMLVTLKEAEKGQESDLNSLILEISKKYDLNRLKDIITDFQR